MTTRGELTRGFAKGLGTPNLTLSQVAAEAVFGRWSHQVRGELYLFEMLSGLRMESDRSGGATLYSGDPKWSVSIKRPAFDTDEHTLKEELGYVLKMATLRNDRMAEILTQVAVPKSFFAMVLNLRPDQHRYTYEVMAAALMLSPSPGSAAELTATAVHSPRTVLRTRRRHQRSGLELEPPPRSLYR